MTIPGKATPTEWSELALSALKATYGYEWQEEFSIWSYIQIQEPG